MDEQEPAPPGCGLAEPGSPDWPQCGGQPVTRTGYSLQSNRKSRKAATTPTLTRNSAILMPRRTIIWACRSSDGDGRAAADAGHRLSTEHHQDHSRERAGGRAEAPGEVIRAEMSEDDATAPRAED